MSKKYTYQEVKDYIENDNGYKLLEKTYRNCKQKLQIQCNKGHIFYMAFDSFKNSGCRCPECNIGGNHKYNIEIAKQIFKDKNCELLEQEYIDCDTPMRYICQCGNESKISLTEFMLGHRCVNCKRRKIAKALKLPFSEIQQLFAKNNCILLSDESDYENFKSVVHYQCSCGNKAYISIAKFAKGQRCTICMSNRRKNTNTKRFGSETPSGNTEINNKIRKTLYKNNSAPASKQQIYLCNLLNGKLNYPLKTSSLDIVLPDKIYIEYDGGLHRGQVLFGNMTDEEFDKKEKQRTYGLMRSGWKEIRIISTTDKLPQDEIVIEMIDFAKKYLREGYHYIKFDIDNLKMINSQGIFDYDYGKLRRIYNKDIQEAV